MSSTNGHHPFTPALMTPEVGAALREAGYILPESWPTNARVSPLSSATGWTVKTIGSGKDEGMTVYTAPDGTQFTPAVRGARVVLVGLSRRVSALPLRVVPGTRRPKWVLEDTPKGEIPEHLKRWLLKPGQKLTKGEQRIAAEAEAFAMEPLDAARRIPVGDRAARGAIKAVLGPEPRHDKAARREWTKRWRALRAERLAAAGPEAT